MEARTIRSVAEVTASAWDALVGANDPFVEHAFLLALERSGSVGPGSGWDPHHVIVHDASGLLVGALPVYVKDDSWGEFIFDFQWARAAEQAGIRYYPKVTAMVPFTPATGTRFLVHPEADRARVVTALLRRARTFAEEAHASSLHVLFLNDHERDEAIQNGLRPRLSLQFHWQNQGWNSFEDYLQAFRSPSRKQVRRERREVLESGVEIQVKDGTELGDAEWKALVTFYRMNCARHGSYPDLTPGFFEEIRRTNARRLVAVIAYENGAPIAASINFEKGAHLYGRYWGSVQDTDFLHFEVCYYRLIERALEKRMTRFEAGAQGMHKLKRGLLPSKVHSAHWLRDPMLSRAVDSYLPAEAMAVQREIDELSESSPFRRG